MCLIYTLTGQFIAGAHGGLVFPFPFSLNLVYSKCLPSGLRHMMNVWMNRLGRLTGQVMLDRQDTQEQADSGVFLSQTCSATDKNDNSNCAEDVRCYFSKRSDLQFLPDKQLNGQENQADLK